MLNRLNYKLDISLFILLTFIMIFLLVPFVWAISNSLKSDMEILGSSLFLPKVWHWTNYRTAWNEGNFNVYFWNSVIISVTVVVLKVIIVAPAGYAFAKLRARKYHILFYMFLFGMAVPAQSLVISLFYQLKAYNLLDSLWGVSLPLVGLEIPLGVFLMRNFFRELSNSLKESAEIDGAGVWIVFMKIMLPMSKPVLMVVAIFGFLDAWNEYMLSILVLISDESKTLPLGIVKFFGTQYYDSDYGAVFASVVISFVPSILVYVLLQRSFIQGISSGALKE